MLDLSKEYVTRDGYRIIGLVYKPLNSAGQKVTFPYKGSILIPGRRNLKYNIWKEDGSSDIFNPTRWDLVEKV